MRLTHLRIERFRGIPLLEMSLDPVTVVIGENNHGKTSLFDVLGLCLARRSKPSDDRFREGDFFRRSADGTLDPIRIVLTFTEDLDAGSQDAAFDPAFVRAPDGSRLLRAEFVGEYGDRSVTRRFVDAEGVPISPQPDPSLFHLLRNLHPVLLLRFTHEGAESGSVRAPERAGGSERRGRRSLEARVEKVYRDLTHTRGPLPTSEIARGLRAARRLFGRSDPSTGDDAPMHRMLAEILTDPGELGLGDTERPFRVRAGSGTHSVGILLVLGAMLEVRGDEALPEGATPIIAIEEPAAHLHPILLASTWDVIESLRAQIVVTTNSSELLSSAPMRSLRRLVRRAHEIDVRSLGAETLGTADLRRLRYHIRAKRGGVLFARCWLLVEGESEFWLMTHLAHVLGRDLDAEGVRCVEFAQCGVTPLVKLANDLGIEWHLLADGDESGTAYAREARHHLDALPPERRVTQLSERDVERCLWEHGFEDVYREAAGTSPRGDHRRAPQSPHQIIAKAVRKKSKPHLALLVAEQCAVRGPASIPPPLRGVIETSVALARSSVSAGGTVVR